ncbi:hypothetical protein [Mycoplasmopsis alligatoris]|uniref:Uncharacterized protein n=1 Tax=Mycoplasmopsis alligatoris A21JP2 TaxID=747682 RepID=D4XX36_9BACT|nr:hypothetical protein [Mycoplasmopsis alligatoris]EFF41092.1 hypothetical protein MALL_0810 [Mycoplasmopsis alligatoris A21JP2]
MKNYKDLIGNKTYKYWKIGTCFGSYFNTILRWLRDERFIKQIQNLTISVKERDSSITEVYFEQLGDIIFYNGSNNSYKKTTIKQFLALLKCVDIIEYTYNDEKIKFNQLFINNLKNNISEKIENNKFLTNYILDRTKLRFEVLIDDNNDVADDKQINSFIYSVWLTSLNKYSQEKGYSFEFSVLLEKLREIDAITKMTDLTTILCYCPEKK